MAEGRLKTGIDTQETKCWLCGLNNHIKRNCPSLSCHFCQKNHLKKHCLNYYLELQYRKYQYKKEKWKSHNTNVIKPSTTTPPSKSQDQQTTPTNILSHEEASQTTEPQPNKENSTLSLNQQEIHKGNNNLKSSPNPEDHPNLKTKETDNPTPCTSTRATSIKSTIQYTSSKSSENTNYSNKLETLIHSSNKQYIQRPNPTTSIFKEDPEPPKLDQKLSTTKSLDIIQNPTPTEVIDLNTIIETHQIKVHDEDSNNEDNEDDEEEPEPPKLDQKLSTTKSLDAIQNPTPTEVIDLNTIIETHQIEEHDEDSNNDDNEDYDCYRSKPMWKFQVKDLIFLKESLAIIEDISYAVEIRADKKGILLSTTTTGNQQDITLLKDVHITDYTFNSPASITIFAYQILDHIENSDYHDLTISLNNNGEDNFLEITSANLDELIIFGT